MKLNRSWPHRATVAGFLILCLPGCASIDYMNSFDSYIMTYINQFSRYSWKVDHLIVFIANNNLLKGGLLLSIIWWLWFNTDKQLTHKCEKIISTLLCSLVALFICRILTLTLPFRPRPLYQENLIFLVPYGIHKTDLDSLSSFPSDHSVLFFALSTGLFLISKKIGAFALVYTALFIALPRIYLGFHYPTDIIGGALIGIVSTWSGNKYFMQSKYLKLIIRYSVLKPDYFYPVFFILSYQIADLFGGIRSIIKAGYNLF